MTIYDWPSVLGPRGVAFNKRGQTVAGPPSLTGRTQVASLDAGYWVAGYRGVNAGGASRVRAYRALTALLEGGAHQIRVPVFDVAQAPWPLDSAGNPITSVSQVAHSDDALFSDLTGYAQSSIDAYLTSAAALRATSVAVAFRNAGTRGGGEYFSIGDRLYLVRAVLADDGAGNLTLAIWPPLREAAASGAVLNFDRPVCRMRLASESSADLDLDWGRFGFPDMAFVEVF